MAENTVTTPENHNTTTPKTRVSAFGLLQQLLQNPKLDDTESLEPAQPLYVVGDIHGRIDLLDALLARIFREASRDAHLVFVGDYIDRGPSSAAVIRALRCLENNANMNVTCLRGNHEAMMLDFLDAPHANAFWLRNGGRKTLESYGVADPGHDPSPDELVDIRNALHAALPSGDEAFLRRLPLSFKSGNVFVSHAGANPLQPLSMQTQQALVWGDASMLTTPRDDGMWVVHGHYIQSVAEANARRIGVDTGAFYTGQLCAARIQPGTLGIMVS